LGGLSLHRHIIANFGLDAGVKPQKNGFSGLLSWLERFAIGLSRATWGECRETSGQVS
jgi:hypothetical protein